MGYSGTISYTLKRAVLVYIFIYLYIFSRKRLKRFSINFYSIRRKIRKKSSPNWSHRENAGLSARIFKNLLINKFGFRKIVFNFYYSPNERAFFFGVDRCDRNENKTEITSDPLITYSDYVKQKADL